MIILVAVALVAVAAAGLVILVVQVVSLARHLASPAPRPRQTPPISILKPLCGRDDDLAAHLERFANLRYPRYELLLGIERVGDPAYPVAAAAAARWPDRVRVVLRRGEPVRNPKVNQLITLAAAARHDLLVVSDSNVRVDPLYLSEIAAYFDDPTVGLVTHPVAGAGARRLGARLDNLHLSTAIGPGMVAAQRVARKVFVVGKSMALRRADLARLGGFAALGDHLAEDYVLGRRVAGLGKRVAIARRPVFSVACDRSVADFFRRYRRWGVIHRQAVGRAVYAGELVLNPIVVATVAAALTRTPLAGALLAAAAGLKVALDAAAVRLLHRRWPGARELCALPIKDLLLAAAWWHGFVRSRVDWRGKPLRVLAETRLGPTPPSVPVVTQTSQSLHQPVA
jgi:ceramide glucosyltransferase